MSQTSAGPGITGGQLRAEAEDWILKNAPDRYLVERNLEILGQPLIHPHLKIRHGSIVDEILAETKDRYDNLLIMGAYRREGGRDIFLDDLVQKILFKIDRSILFVPLIPIHFS